MTTVLEYQDARISIEDLDDTKRRLSVISLNKDLFIPIRQCETTYPLDLIKLILTIKGPAYLCDEIMREENPTYVQLSLKYSILGYVGENLFENKRILDFGCGSGSSTIILDRMFPKSAIVGIDIDDNVLNIGRLRARHYKIDNIKFVKAPDSDHLPDDLGNYDFVILSAVFEHLLAHERKNLLSQLWDIINPSGILFINQTPYRYFFVESHTTGLPLINYFPDRLTHFLATRFSNRVSRDATWETLLRKGIRGGTEKEIINLISGTDNPPKLLEPHRLGLKDRIDLWYALSTESRNLQSKLILKSIIKTVKLVFGVTITPSLSLALKKQAN